MEQKYYIVVDEKQEGPFSIEELKNKNIKRNTLVWTENMEDWMEAKNIVELEIILKKSPPPIPSKIDKPLKVEAEITKKKEKLITPKVEVAVAKETKSAFNSILYALIIGVVSFPIFYFGVYEVNKYDNYDINKNVHTDYGTGRSSASGLNLSDFPSSVRLDPQSLRSAIEYRKEYYTGKSATGALIIFLIATAVLLAIRYISKGAKWVDETSKKSVD